MRVLTVDDNPIIRVGLRAVLEGADAVQAVFDTGQAEEAVRIVSDGEADIVLLDVQMPRVSGLELLPRLVAHVPVIMLTHDENSETLAEAMSSGASGYLVHGSLEPEAIVDALRMCLQGGTIVAGAHPVWRREASAENDPGAQSEALEEASGVLTDRERDVMAAIARGLTNREIADTLFLTEKTVKNNINRIFAKMQVKSRGEAIARWNGLGPT